MFRTPCGITVLGIPIIYLQDVNIPHNMPMGDLRESYRYRVGRQIINLTDLLPVDRYISINV